MVRLVDGRWDVNCDKRHEDVDEDVVAGSGAYCHSEAAGNIYPIDHKKLFESEQSRHTTDIYEVMKV